MVKVSRNDLQMLSESGGDWFCEFLQSLAKHELSSVQDILNTINNKKSESVENIVQNYREQVGLDTISSSESSSSESRNKIKQANIIYRPLSLRHASGIGPIAPMKLKKLENPDDILKNNDDSNIIIQIKLDGFKTQAIKDKAGAVKLYTRRGEDFSSNVPSLVKDLEDKMENGSFFLGELVWEDKNGKQSISDIQTVVNSSPEKAQEKIKSGNGKALFYVYDLLWFNGDDITKKDYIERYNKLKELIGKGTDTIKIVDNYTYSDKDKAINDALKVNAEGIVLKPKDSKYKYGAKGSNEPYGEWAKFKPGAKAKTDEVILNKYNKGEDKLVFPAYQYYNGKLVEVGKLSGLPKEEEQEVRKKIDNGKVVVIEVSYQEKMESGKFRHMGYSRLRPDKPQKEVKVDK
jgi:bifunctional non-homologous end joining protein LigD